MGFLRTAETRWGPDLARQHHLPTHLTGGELAEATGMPVPLWAAHRHGGPAFAAARPPAGISFDVCAVAHVNWGRWLAHCPFCNAAHEVSQDDPRFYCPLCLNAGAGGDFLAVAWPDPATVAAIEDILGRRPDVRTRNWRPGETIEQLRAENAAHRAELLPHPVLA